MQWYRSSNHYEWVVLFISISSLWKQKHNYPRVREVLFEYDKITGSPSRDVFSLNSLPIYSELHMTTRRHGMEVIMSLLKSIKLTFSDLLKSLISEERSWWDIVFSLSFAFTCKMDQPELSILLYCFLSLLGQCYLSWSSSCSDSWLICYE